jgi:hypothetical protein
MERYVVSPSVGIWESEQSMAGIDIVCWLDDFPIVLKNVYLAYGPNPYLKLYLLCH